MIFHDLWTRNLDLSTFNKSMDTQRRASMAPGAHGGHHGPDPKNFAGPQQTAEIKEIMQCCRAQDVSFFDKESVNHMK
jgi:hypothetical protein